MNSTIVTELVRYRGVDRRGVARSGAIGTESAALLAERLFKAGWRSLSVTRDGYGYPVAEILPDYATHRRTWWAEP